MLLIHNIIYYMPIFLSSSSPTTRQDRSGWCRKHLGYLLFSLPNYVFMRDRDFSKSQLYIN